MDYRESLQYARILDAMEGCGVEKLDTSERVELMGQLRFLWLSGYNEGYTGAVKLRDVEWGCRIGQRVRNVWLRLRAVFTRRAYKQPEAITKGEE